MTPLGQALTARPRRVVRFAVAVAAVLAGAGLLDVEPSAAQRGKLVLIGALTEAWGPTPTMVGLREGLIELGYRENEHFAIGIRFTGGNASPDELLTAARQLVAGGAQILVTGGGSAAAQAAKLATQEIPVVFLGGSDPVGMGIVKSFRRPGGNVTGVADLDVELAPKRLEILRDLIPGLKRVLYPYDAGEPHADVALERHRKAAARLGVSLVEMPLRTQDEARAALAAVRKGDADGILAPRSVSLNIPAFVLEATNHSTIPAMFHDALWVEQGGFASYSANAYEVGRQAARLVDRIIKGAKPRDLPVEQATHFDLVVNLKAAKSLGLTVPPQVLLRAQRVIQ